MNPSIVPAEYSHIPPIVENIRSEDLLELEALGDETPFEALTKSLEGSVMAWTMIRPDGGPMGMFGLGKVSLTSSDGCVWLIGTTEILAHRVWFLRQSQKYVRLMGTMCERMIQAVDARYGLCLRWLAWSGFTIHDPEPIGKNGEMFCRVERTS